MHYKELAALSTGHYLSLSVEAQQRVNIEAPDTRSPILELEPF